jgi:hypothetical protein
MRQEKKVCMRAGMARMIALDEQPRGLTIRPG